MSALQVNQVVVAVAKQMYLHPCSVDIEGKVAIANLERCCLIVNEVGSHDIELRDNGMPTELRNLFARRSVYQPVDIHVDRTYQQ